MKNFLVIGNPIEHSLSPQLHNFWIKRNNIDAIYKKKKLDDSELKNLILEVKNKKINGINVTTPFKKKIIDHLDTLSSEAEITQSVNTIFLDNDKVVGHNTDIDGFEKSIKDTKFNISQKNVFILGAGGVVPSLIFSLMRMKASKVTITNRTKINAENLKASFQNLDVIDWGNIPNFDMIINATSIGLNKNEEINLDLSKEKDKFFYDIIYNPSETNFLRSAKRLGNKVENGKKMFIYQAAAAFKIWHGFYPKVDEEVIKILD